VIVADSRPSATTAPPADRLRLRAHDAADLQVVSACLQDAILPIGDMTYEHAARRFVLVANRFCWERANDREAAFDRVNCGVVFDGVNAVRLRRIDRNDRALMLSLLAITHEDLPKGVALTLVCADNRDIRLEADGIAVRLEDFDAAWPTVNRPSHDLEGAP
jgi:hypothetical protein